MPKDGYFDKKDKISDAIIAGVLLLVVFSGMVAFFIWLAFILTA